MARSSDGDKVDSDDKRKDKSLHGLIVALAMAGTIAGSVIFFAYAASDVPPYDETTGVADTGAFRLPSSETTVAEKNEPNYIEKIKYINRTVEVKKRVPVYINNTVVKEVPVYIEKPAYIDRPVYVNDTNAGADTGPTRDKPNPDSQRDEHQENKREQKKGSQLEDFLTKTIPDRIRDLFDEDELHEEDDDLELDNKKDKHKEGDD